MEMDNQYLTASLILCLIMKIPITQCSYKLIPEKVSCYNGLDLLSSATDFAKVIDVNDGVLINLLCSFCSGNFDNSPRVWCFKRGRHHQPFNCETELYSDKTHFIIDSKNSLLLNKFNHSLDSGIYSCKSKMHDKVTFTYILDGVFNVSVKPLSGIFAQWPKYKKLKLEPVNQQFENPSEEPFITFRNTSRISFRVKTYWQDWGPCEASSNINFPGIRTKMGQCRLQVVPNYHYVKNTSKNDPTNIFNWEPNYDVPCRSKTLNEILPEISEFVRSIPDYETTEKCVLNSVLLKKEAKDGESQSTTTIQVLENGHCVLTCLEETPEYKVEWYKNKTLLNSSHRIIMGNMEERTHLTVDSLNMLYILHATKNDEAIYHCIVNGKNIKKYIVKVISKCGLINDDFFRYSVYLGFVLLLTTTCYCAGICVAWHERSSFADPLILNLKKEKRRL